MKAHNMVDAELFVRLWMEGKTYEEIAKAVGCHLTYVYTFANRLRKKGVELPQRGRNSNKRQIDVAALNKIITGGGS